MYYHTNIQSIQRNSRHDFSDASNSLKKKLEGEYLFISYRPQHEIKNIKKNFFLNNQSS